jgi:hypothetical protein
LSLLIGAGGFWLFKNKKTEIKPPLQKGESFISGLFQKNQNDSDNDGLQDWKEVLWKTDKNNPDTDGDGTLDGEEIKLNRDPRKPGPDDKLSEIKTMAGLENGNEWTMTDALTRDFFANFLALQQSGNLTPENKEKLTDFFLAGIAQEKLTDKYKLSDLKIINDNNNAALKNYGNEVAEIINKYQAMGNESEATIIKRAIKNEDESELQKLVLTIQLYQDVSRDLLTVKTPRNLSNDHLVLINSTYNLSQALTNIKGIFKDPIAGIIGINQYQKEFLRTNQALLNINKQISAQ